MDTKTLVCLVKIGNMDGVRKLVRQGTPLDYLEDRRSPLMHAAVSKKVGMVRELLDMGASVDFTNDDGLTALHYAATSGSLKEAEALLDAGAELEGRTNTGRTPLALACRNGRLPTAKMLQERGADPNARDNTGWTLLFMAARAGSLPVVKWLVEELDADPRPEINGRNAEKLAESKKHLEVAEYLRNVLRNLPDPIKEGPSLKKSPSGTSKRDSKKLSVQANSLHESYWVSGGAVGPAKLKVKYVQNLVQPSHDIYDTTTDPPGLVLLLNYRKFSEVTHPEREGAEYDTINLVSVFEQMGYEVESHENKTWEETIWCLKEFSESERLKKVGCAIVVVSSHGGNEKRSFSTSDCQDVSVDYIRNLFIENQCREVREMAKLFFFQFCRGDFSPEYHVELQMDNLRRAAPENIISFFSASDGFVSYRAPLRGSKFLLVLCEVLAENAHEECLDELFREVQRRYSMDELRATPEKQDLNFMKKFYFNPRPREC
ncbi:caspase-1-like isoform X1 [Eriocheir sinensis]|uniref:caspase-1-like isoform X1 n=2 Tax=Eriocheir sinensis TaxID=95602 RepID=UPI0021C8EB03|nr:caspase-1-like isoform X1 [Eriocheir sinensis]